MTFCDQFCSHYVQCLRTESTPCFEDDPTSATAFQVSGGGASGKLQMRSLASLRCIQHHSFRFVNLEVSIFVKAESFPGLKSIRHADCDPQRRIDTDPQNTDRCSSTARSWAVGRIRIENSNYAVDRRLHRNLKLESSGEFFLRLVHSDKEHVLGVLLSSDAANTTWAKSVLKTP